MMEEPSSVHLLYPWSPLDEDEWYPMTGYEWYPMAGYGWYPMTGYRWYPIARVRVVSYGRVRVVPYGEYGWYPIARELTADDKYYCPPLEDAGNIVGVSGVDRKKWLRQAFDCDDFAYVLKAHFAEAAYVDGMRVDRPAHCLGILFGTVCISDKEPGSHAVNWMVDDKRELHFIEPQKDYLIDPQTGRVRHINVDSETGQVSYLEIPEKFEFKDICLMLV